MDSIKIIFYFIITLLDIILGVFFFYFIRLFFSIEAIGYYGAIISFLETFAFLTNLGFSIAHLKLVSEVKNSEEIALYNGTFLKIRIIQYIVYIFVIILLINTIKEYEKDLFVVYIFLLAKFFFITGDFFKPIFLAKKNIIKSSIPLVTSSLIKIILLFIFIIQNRFLQLAELLLIAYITLISNSIYFLINLFLIRKISIKKSTSDLRNKYLKYSLPFFITSSLVIIVNNIDILFVNLWFPIGDVANYFTAKQIYLYMTFFQLPISNILISTFSRNIFLGKNEKNLEIISKTHKFLNLLISPAVLLICLYNTEIIIIIFGKDYRLSGIILSIFSLNLLIISINCANIFQLEALGEVNFLAKFEVFTSLLAIILMVIFISPEILNMGAIGGAIALLIAYLISQILFRIIIYKKYALGMYWGSIRNLGIIFGIYIFHLYIDIIYISNIINFVILILMDIFLYFSINYIMKGFSKEDLQYFFWIINIKNIIDVIFSE